jgi:DNA-binding FadR family transcriptional regulator
MTWEPVRKVRTHEQVLAQIERKILDGSLRPGEKLPSERDLVTALGVSRTSVREALRALEAMGIIAAKVGSGRDSGSVVTGRSTDALTTLLRLHLALAQISLADLVDTRIQLERGAARGAAAAAAPTDIAGLQTLIEEMRSPDLDYPRFNTLDTEFHVGVARVSGNALAANLMQALRAAVESEMTAAFERLPEWRTAADALVNEHEAILRAIEKGAGDAAADLVTDHIRGFYRDRIRNPGPVG